MKSAKKRILYSAFLLINCCFVYTQSATGLYVGDYSGIHGTILNPASSRFSKLPWDVNLAGFHGFGHTDYAFALQSNLFHYLQNFGQLQQVPANSDVVGLDPNNFYYDFNPDVTSTTASSLFDLTGPSALVNFENFSLGAFTRLRIQGGTHHISEGLSYTRVNRTPFGEEIALSNENIQGMAWTEIGLSFSSDRLLPFDGASIGVNAKFLNGHQGGFIQNLDNLTYTRLNRDSLRVSGPELEMGFTNSMIDDQSSPLQSNGKGIALDLGISYKLPKGVLNISILDIGIIRFKNAEVYRIESGEIMHFDLEPFRDATDLRTLINLIDSQASENLNVPTILVDDQITIGMPTRLHADFNYTYRENIFLGVSIDQRIPLKRIAVEAENVLTLFPRYEKKWFMASLPISIYEYERIRVGAAFRFGFLTIGSDHLFSLLGKSNFRGSSLYGAIKLTPFWSKKSKTRGAGRNGVECPQP